MKSNKSWQIRLAQIFLGAVFLLALVVVRGTHAGNEPTHLTTDWSHRHVIFSAPQSLGQHIRLLSNPRYLQQLIRRNAQFQGNGDEWRWRRAPETPDLLHGDWSMDIGTGATAGVEVYPAKSSFSPTAANCDNAVAPNEPDYVVYNSSLAGKAPVSASQTVTFGGTGTSGVPVGTVIVTNGTNTLTLTAGTSFAVVADSSAGNRTTNATNLAAAINLAGNGSSVGVSATSAAGVVTITAYIGGTGGNAITLTGTLNGSQGVAFGGATLAGGVAGQASIVAFDNLYSSCPVTSVPFPNVYWAYNTGTTGAVVTSPIISGDSSQVAFIQSTGAAAELVLLKWKQSAATVTTNFGTTTSGSPTVTITSGTVTQSDVGLEISGDGIPAGDTIAGVTGATVTLATNATGSFSAEALTITAESAAAPGVPPTVTNANYRACTAPCMTTVSFGAAANTDTNSSPFYDFTPGSDTIYVGDNDGNLHRFGGVFEGTPGAEPTNWPVAVAAGTILTSPVFDSGDGLVIVAGNARAVYSVNVTSRAVVTSSTLSGGSGIDFVDSPVLDSSTGDFYLFSGRIAGGASAEVFELPVTFGAGAAATSEEAVGTVSTTVPVYAGDFDNTYYSSANGTGHLYACGNPGGSPTLYQITVTAGALTAVAASPAITNLTTPCSGITENFIDATHDYMFTSMHSTGTTKPTNCTTGTGCVVGFNVAAAGFTIATAAPVSSANAAGGSSGIVVDGSSTTVGASQVYFTPLTNQTCTTSGGTGGCAIQASQSGLD